MNRPVSLIMSLASMALPLVACLAAEPNEEGYVRQVVSSFAETWNHHDMDAFGRLFAPDADFVNVVGDWWKGRQAIQMRHAYSHGTILADAQGEPLPYYGIFKTSTLRFTEIDVRFLRKDVAVAHASCELLGDARTPNPRRCLITFVLARQDGAWLIAAAQNTEINRTVK
jgi:ketosteroid isomerase-like protein